MASKVLANDLWDRNAASYVIADWPQDNEVERELTLVEDLILTLDAADAFVEDLVSLHIRRNALLAALSIHRRNSRASVVNRASWHQLAVETNHAANDCVAEQDVTTGGCERKPDRER
jgi:hypothetical protein